MTNETTQLYKEFTDALPERTVPECWPEGVENYCLPEKRRTIAWLEDAESGILHPGEKVSAGWCLTPTLAQVKQFIEWKGYSQSSGVASHPYDYFCSIGRARTTTSFLLKEPEGLYYGASELEAVARAAVEVAKGNTSTR